MATNRLAYDTGTNLFTLSVELPTIAKEQLSMLFNFTGTIERARYHKREARAQAQLIRILDPFQQIFNMPCWMSDTEHFRIILAEITRPDNAPEHWHIVNRVI